VTDRAAAGAPLNHLWDGLMGEGDLCFLFIVGFDGRRSFTVRSMGDVTASVPLLVVACLLPELKTFITYL
jgi:hypothetical protein